MSSKVPNIVLNNGKNMPVLGLGTGPGSAPGVVTQAVKDAIEIGYRHIDCALIYGNETEVGDGISAKISDGSVKREDLFITTKLWSTFHRSDLVRGACQAQLKNLKIAYLDMYLIHWPMAYKEGDDLMPMDSNGKTLNSDSKYTDTWKEMEKLVDDGLCKSIGVSNFNKRQVENLLSNCRIKPTVNQVECHPYLTQKKLMEFLKTKQIVMTSYCPLGSPNRPWAQSGEPVLIEDPKIKAIAEKNGKTIPQILIRFQIQCGNIVIPKSTNKGRLASNLDVFGFELNKEDITNLESLNRNYRYVTMNMSYGHPEHPFEKDEF